ncbi:MAG: exostosin family protein [Cyanobacteria bacterium J06621_8]
MQLKIFSDQKYLLDAEGVKPHEMLRPFWSGKTENPQYPWFNHCDEYIETAQLLFNLVSLEEADLAVMPDDWKTVTGEVWYSSKNQAAEKLYMQFIQLVQQAQKPLVVFFSGDCASDNVPFEDTYVFRTADFQSKRKPKSFVYPQFCEDLVKFYLKDQLNIRQKSVKPTVGFCGLIKENTWQTRLKTILYYLHRFYRRKPIDYAPIQGHVLRGRAAKMISESTLVEDNFIIHNNMVFLGKNDFDNMYTSRVNFVDNIVSSDYVLCCRGAGNYSIRLFETLCCGRIPIFINTDCVLPFDFAIDWKKYCIWIEEHELPNISEKVAEFHAQITPQEFIDLQYECRKLWKEWLSCEGFFSKFYLHFNFPGNP